MACIWLATLAALLYLRQGRRDGSAIATWLAIYALGRFLLEHLRDDPSRGVYGPLSSAQIISLAILVGLGLAAWLRGSAPVRALEASETTS